MSHGFCCGYCLENIETPFPTDAGGQASKYAHERGWCFTFGRTRHFEGDCHVICPNCSGGDDAISRVPLYVEAQP